jgi:hypothetical protein
MALNIMSNFTEWTLAALERRFKLRMITDHHLLSEWMQAAAIQPVSAEEKGVLAIYQNGFKANAFGWNEQELSLNFIGPIIGLVNFTTENTNFFAGRELVGEVDGEPLRGKPDGMIASGRMEHEKPYFCFQEYKKGIDPNGDPYGQCLVAMLTAQTINDARHPIYGVVVVGQQWNFLILDKTNYSISHGFISLDDDIFFIFKLLKTLKETIIAYAAADHQP